MSIEEQFKAKVHELRSNDSKSALLTKDEYFALIHEVKEAQDAESKNRRQFYVLGRYQILQCGVIAKLIKRRSEGSTDTLYFVHNDELFDIIKQVHISTGHGGRDKMQKVIFEKYANITRAVIELYKSLCLECLKKRKRHATKGVVVKPILCSGHGSRAQVDLIDMQSIPNGKNKWILVYQDHLTKFCILRAMSSKPACEVAYNLVDIFLLFGAPQILQSVNGSKFTASVITELKELWPDLLIVHGKPRHPQSQGSVGRLNLDIKDMLISWLSDNNSSDWAVGLKFVQFMKNTSYHSGIKQSPYSALFSLLIMSKRNFWQIRYQ